MVLGREVQFDNNTNPHLGYHYDPLDFLVSQLSVSGAGAVALLTNGVAVGIYGHYGFSVSEQGAVIGEAGPLAMNRLCFYPSVQEQPVLLDSVATAGSGVFDVSAATSTTANIAKPIINLRFTDFPMLGLRQKFFNGTTYPLSLRTVSLKDCWLRGVNLEIAAADASDFPANAIPLLALTNNLLERSSVILTNGLYLGKDNPLSFAFYNNLFWQGTLSLTFNANGTSPTYTPTWGIRDNLFDTTNGISFGGGAKTTSVPPRSYNAFYNTADWGNLAGTSDVTLNPLAYATGPEGSPWYVGSSTPSIYQVDTSRSAAAAGLYHYTAKTDGTKAGSGNGSIGWHHVALGANNLPADYDSDLLADYWENEPGDGNAANGRSSWTVANTDNPLNDVALNDLSDYIEFIEGRNARVVGTVSDTGGLVALEIYTPNR